MSKENLPRSIKQTLILLALASTFALTFAYISQFVFDYQPCVLCFYQRKPFFAIIAAALLCLTFFKSEKSKKLTFFCCIGLLLINCAISFYHVGVEKKIFQGPTTCSSTNLDEIDNLEDLKSAMMQTKAIRCDEPSFVFLGLSMAAWNFLYCSFLVFLGLLFYRRHR